MDVSRLLQQWLDAGIRQETLVSHPCVVLSVTLFFLFFSIWLMNRSSQGKKKHQPPSPPTLPFIGNIHQLGKLLHQAFHQLSQKYGPLMLLHVGYTPYLIVSSAEMAKEFKSGIHEVAFANRPQTTATKLFLYQCTDIGFSPYGEYWMRMRKISVMELLSTKKVQSFRKVREEEVAVMLEKVSRSCHAGTPTRIPSLVTTLTNDIICRCALGRKHQEGDGGQHDFGEMAGKLTKLLTAFSFGDLYPLLGWMDHVTGLIGKIKKVSSDIDNFFDKIIDEHLNKIQNNDPDYNTDFVDILLQAQRENPKITRDNIKAIILDVFVGGTETVATTMEWALAEIVKNPDVMKKLQEEVRSVVGKKNKVEEEDLVKMEYLRCVVKEALRLHPPSAINVLESAVETKVKGYDIPAKTRVVLNVWAIQRDPKSWDRPEEFIPERFTNNPIDFKGMDFKFTPFGAGRRGCPGISFGVIVLEYALANLLYWFDWSTPGGEELDMSEGVGFSCMKKIPLELVPKSHFC